MFACTYRLPERKCVEAEVLWTECPWCQLSSVRLTVWQLHVHAHTGQMNETHNTWRRTQSAAPSRSAEFRPLTGRSSFATLENAAHQAPHATQYNSEPAIHSAVHRSSPRTPTSRASRPLPQGSRPISAMGKLELLTLAYVRSTAHLDFIGACVSAVGMLSVFFKVA